MGLGFRPRWEPSAQDAWQRQLLYWYTSLRRLESDYRPTPAKAARYCALAAVLVLPCRNNSLNVLERKIPSAPATSGLNKPMMISTGPPIIVRRPVICGTIY